MKSPTCDTTPAWCRRAAQGDREAASRLLAENYRRIYAYLRRLVQNDADAEDLTQETFQRVWQSIHKYRDSSKVTTWLHRIAYCAWVDWVRSSKASSDRNRAWWSELPSEFPPPSNSIQNHECLERLWELVRGLPGEQSMAIQLRYGQQLSLRDTAEVMALPLSTLKSRIKAGLETLRSHLENSEHELNSFLSNTP